MKSRYGVDFLPAGHEMGDPGFAGWRVEEFFQYDEYDNPKGVLVIELSEESWSRTNGSTK